MPDFYLYRILSNVKKRDTVAIYGSSKIALEIKKYILEKRKDIKIACFVEFKVPENNTQDGIKIIDFNEFLKNKEKYDTVIIAKRDNVEALTKIFRQSEINYVEISEKDLQKLAYKNFEESKKMFATQKDKELFTVLYVSSLTSDKKLYYSYIDKNPVKSKEHEYLEFIKKNNLKTIIDTGVNNGYNSMVFQNEIKNIETIYCFDSLHDYVQNGLFITNKQKELTYYKIIQYSPKIKMIGKILWNCENAEQFKERKLQTIPLDVFKEQNNLKIDFIKFDIDALELNVLKGCIKTFKTDRPQIAIKIYQMPSRDYTEIMMFLKKILKKYTYKIGVYNNKIPESILYCIPEEIIK